MKDYTFDLNVWRYLNIQANGNYTELYPKYYLPLFFPASIREEKIEIPALKGKTTEEIERWFNEPEYRLSFLLQNQF